MVRFTRQRLASHLSDMNQTKLTSGAIEMSDIKMAKYAMTTIAITKDGHTMFRDDIVNDLNRKSHLESLTLEQQQKISELKAQSDKAIYHLKDCMSLIINEYGDGACNDAKDFLNKTPKQCLASVKADAGKSGFYEGFSRSGQGFNDEHGCEPIELETMANLYASEIREQK